MLLNSDAKRLLIFMFYDKDGIVDRYISYMLNDMKKNVSEIIFVSNGKISEKSKLVVNEITPNIIERENKGLEVAAYITAMEKVGWENLKQYDELILMNSTIMGPVYPFKEMFDAMNKKDIDFWGITKHPAVCDSICGLLDDGYIPEHIQAYFIVVRNSILRSDEFKKYWSSLPKINTYEETIAYYEVQFTSHFSELNFLWDVYINTNDLEKYVEYPLLHIPVKMISEKRCPIFKRRSFILNYGETIKFTVGEHSRELMEYLRDKTSYDIDLIWENILRCYNMSDIKNCLQLNYVLPINGTNISSSTLADKKIALIFHAHFEDLVDQTVKHINMMPAESDIYITTNTTEKKRLFEKLFENHKFRNLKVLLIENRGRDVSALLVASKKFVMNYDYVCFAHDKKSAQSKHRCIGESYSYQCLENVLGSEDYIKNIIELFNQNPRLGIIMPPPPSHGPYVGTLNSGWGINFAGTKFLCDKLKLNISINENISPVATLGSCFWFRPIGMKKLFECDWKYTDFNEEPLATDGTISHAIERAYSLVEQDAGFYAAWCITNRFAPLMITSLNYMLSETLNQVDAKYTSNYQTIKHAIKYQNEITKGMQILNTGLIESFSDIQGNLLREPMKLYYDVEGKFSEKRSINHTIDRNSKRFSLVFYLPNIDLNIKRFRFDPEEAANIFLENLKITLWFEDNSQEDIELPTLKTNGLCYKGKFIFLKKDPWLMFNVSNKKKLKEVRISAEINRDFKPSRLKSLLGKALIFLNVRRFL